MSRVTVETEEMLDDSLIFYVEVGADLRSTATTGRL